MLKPKIPIAILGAMAVLIVGLAAYFILNISHMTLLQSGLLVGVGVVGLLIILGVLVMIIKG